MKTLERVQSLFSFKKKNSVETTLCLAITPSSSYVLILLDLFEIFDTFNIMSAISTIVITALDCFESYLTDGSFKVSWRVPQGFIPGPLLFSMYTT